MAVLFVMLAISDFSKPLQYAQNPVVRSFADGNGLVIFGHKFQGLTTLLMLSPLVGIVLLIYAYGIWRLRPWVLPLSIVYAFYVPYNLVLFWFTQTSGPRSIPFIVRYLAVALIGSVGTAIYLAYHRARLR